MTNRYIKATVDGAVEGAKAEWERTQTFGGVVGYAILPGPYRAPYAVTRAAVALGTGAIVNVRAELQAARAEKAELVEEEEFVADEQPAPRVRRVRVVNNDDAASA